MPTSPESIKRNLYKSKNLTIDFFVYAPQVLYDKNSYTVSAKPIITFKYVNPSILYEQNINLGENAYKMTPRNQVKFIRFFKTIIDWFYDKDLKDLFLINDDNELVFNSDYKHIYASISKNKFDAGLLKAMPTVIIYENERYEGIYLYINKLDNLIMLPLEEVEFIYHLVKSFDFNSEIVNNIAMIEYAEKTGNVTTDAKAFYKMNGASVGKYVSPFDKK